MDDDYSNSTIFALLPKFHTPQSANGFVYINFTKGKLNWRINGIKAGYRRNPEKSECKMLFDRFGIDNIQCIILHTGPFDNRSRLTEKTIEYQFSIPCINKYYYYKNLSNNKENPYFVLSF